jgi:hypothetical protein
MIGLKRGRSSFSSLKVFRACLLGFSAGVGKFMLDLFATTFLHIRSRLARTGLLLMRLVVGMALVVREIIELQVRRQSAWQ